MFSPSCSRYGETEDPILENIAQDDIAVLLMTVGKSSVVNMYNSPVAARMPNLPSITRGKVSFG